MTKSIEATGKTIDLAIQAGLEQLQMDRDSVSVEVLQQPRSGFFGIGSSPAKVSLTYEIPEPVPEPAQKPASEPRPAPKRTSEPHAEPKRTSEPRPAPKRTSEPHAESPKKNAVPKTERKAEPEAEHRPEPKAGETSPDTAAESRKPPLPAPEGTTEARIETFVKGLLEHMGSDAVPSATKTADDIYSVELIGSSLGMLIGRRGETLDAIQHITNYAVNHGQGKHIRVNVDAENYRKKREESLIRLANKVAGKVSRTRRNITLEPMNAYERHVIHAALQDYPNITTFSTGTEPNRRIVVAYSRYRTAPEES